MKHADLLTRVRNEDYYGVGFNNIHDPRSCLSEWCVFHDPSPHHMRFWPKVIRASGLIERVCDHGVGHPDPDSVEFLRKYGLRNWDQHGCDGCCVANPTLHEDGMIIRVYKGPLPGSA